MQVFGPNELVEDVLKRDFCVGCGACVNLCPYFKRSFTLKSDSGHTQIFADHRKIFGFFKPDFTNLDFSSKIDPMLVALVL